MSVGCERCAQKHARSQGWFRCLEHVRLVARAPEAAQVGVVKQAPDAAQLGVVKQAQAGVVISNQRK